jgi:hypothetical protein
LLTELDYLVTGRLAAVATRSGHVNVPIEDLGSDHGREPTHATGNVQITPA